MKKAFTSLFAVFLFSLALAQTAPRFSYQAVVRNDANELVADDSVEVRIRFYNHDVSGVAVYSERHSVVSNSNGLISLMIGKGTEVMGNLSLVTWEDTWVSTEITLRGGYSVSDVKPVTAVPFAYYAEQIPLQALEEHLGSTNLVSADALRDTLVNFVSVTAFSDTLSNYVTTEGMLDTLSAYVTIEELSGTLNSYVPMSWLPDYVSGTLSDSLANYVPRSEWEAAIQSLRDEIHAVKDAVENIVVTSYQTTSNRFVLEHFPMAERKVLMFINGVFISQSAYTMTENQLLYLPANNGNKGLEEGDRVQIYYYYK